MKESSKTTTAIAKVDESQMEGLEPSVRKQFKVMREHQTVAKMIKEGTSHNEIAAAVKALVVKTIFESGQNMEPDEQAETVNGVTRDIFTDFVGYRIPEIAEAFRLGVRGELGEYYGVSVKSFHQWLRTYRDEHLNDLKSKVLGSLPEPTELTEEQKAKIKAEWIENHLRLFEEYRDGEIEFDQIRFAAHFWEHLRKEGLVTTDEQAREEFVGEAMNQIKREKKKQRFEAPQFLRPSIDKFIESLEKGEQGRALVLNRARGLALKSTYDYLIANKTDLRDWLKIESERSRPLSVNLKSQSLEVSPEGE
mgnify:FL=1